MAEPSIPSSDDFWLFGYGSLIWKPPPHFGMPAPPALTIEPRLKGPSELTEAMKTVEYPATSKAMCGGFGKRDHRGTPSSPGRVVTLISHAHYSRLCPPSSPPSPFPPSPRVWGAAYHIPAPYVRAVQTNLDIREINGYSIQYASFTPSDTSVAPVSKCMVYIGLPENPQFLGVQDQDDVAGVIWRSRGPSGENREYLFMLEKALTELGEGVGDEHVEDLARRVREVGEREGEGKSGAEVRVKAIEGEVARAKGGSSSHQQKETQKV